MKRAFHERPLKWLDMHSTQVRVPDLTEFAVPLFIRPSNGAGVQLDQPDGLNWRFGMHPLNTTFPLDPNYTGTRLIPHRGNGPNQRIGDVINWKRLQLDVHIYPRVQAEDPAIGPERYRFLLVYSQGGVSRASDGSGFEYLPWMGDILQMSRPENSGTVSKFTNAWARENPSNGHLFTILRDEWRTVQTSFVGAIQYSPGIPEAMQDMKHGSFTWDVDLTGLTHTALGYSSAFQPIGFGGGDLLLLVLTDANVVNVEFTHVNTTQVNLDFQYRIWFEDATL